MYTYVIYIDANSLMLFVSHFHFCVREFVCMTVAHMVKYMSAHVLMQAVYLPSTNVHAGLTVLSPGVPYYVSW